MSAPGSLQPHRRAILSAASLLSLGLLFFGTALQSACAQSQSQMPASAPALAPYGPDTVPAGQLPLGPGDLVTVTVFNTPELTGPIRVDQTGRLDLPVGGYVTVAGLSPLQAAALIEKQLRDGQIMLAPHVAVQVTQFATQNITVLGEVKSPGSYPLVGPHTLYDALSFAGGTTQLEGATITITHHGDPGHPMVLPVNTPNFSQVQNSTPIYPGDVIFVATADLVTAVGEWSTPGQYPIAQGRELTLLNLVATAHGWTAVAKIHKAIIIRKTPTGTQTIPVDLRPIMHNRALDPVLQASDVIVMPHSTFKQILVYALPAAANSGISAGILAGTGR